MRALAFALAVSAPSLAAADTAPRRAFADHAWEVGVFVEGGRIAFGDVSGGQVGLRGEVARQFGSLRLGAEYSLAKIFADHEIDEDGWGLLDRVDVGGEVARAGLTARVRGVIPDPHVMQHHTFVAGYLEAGLGYQRIVLDDGAVFERPDVSLGLGVEIAGGRDRFGGMDLGVRATIAPSTLPDVPTHDIGVLGYLGGRFGI